MIAFAAAVVFALSACESETAVPAGSGSGAVSSDSGTGGSATTGTTAPDGQAGNPSAPNTLLAFAMNNSVRLAWTPPSKEGPFTYTIYRRLKSGGNFLQVASGLTTTGYTDLAVLNGVGYTYRVQATRANGVTSDTNEESAQPIAMFSILALSQNPATNDVTMTWGQATGATSYDIVSVYAGSITVIQANAVSPAVLSGLASGQHSLQVVARNNVGQGAQVRSSNLTRINLMSGAFSFAVKNVATGIEVSWAPVTGADHYRVFYGTSPGAYVESGVVSVTQSPYVIEGVTGGQTYYVMVYAYGQSLQYSAGSERSIYVGNPVSRSWTFDAGSESSYVTSNSWSTVQLAGGLAKLLFADTTDQDDSSAGFGGGTKTGVAWVSNKLQLANGGGCDATATNCNEIAADWSPQYSNLVLYQRFNGTSGSTVATGASLTSTVGPTLTMTNTNNSASYADGWVKQAWNLDGTDTVTTPSMDLFGTSNDFTIAFWINPAASQVTYANIMSQDHCGNGSQNFVIEQDGGNHNRFYLTYRNSSNSNWEGYSKVTTLTANTWQHVVFLKSGTSIRHFVNGLENGSPVTTADPVIRKINAALTIGNNVGGCGGRGLNGKLDEFAIWKSALTSAEIRSLYEHQRARFSGSFLSRIIAIPTNVPWMKWVTELPFGKELPAAAETAANYAQGAFDWSNGLRGLWHFNEPAGTTGAGGMKDASSFGNHGTAQGATTGVIGRFGQAFNVSASGKVNMGTTSNLAVSSAFTMTAWIYPMGGEGIIINREGEYEIARFSDGQIGYAVANGSPGWNWVYTGAYAPTGVWTHVTWSYDSAATSNQLKVYVNGALVHSRAGSGLVGDVSSGQNEFWVGARQAGGQLFNGSIDEVALWNRQLSDAEALALYRRGANRLSFQVRSCSAADCSDDAGGANWRGLGNSRTQWLSELSNNTIPLATSGVPKATSPYLLFSEMGIPDPAGPYYQYRARFDSDTATYSPHLLQVSSKGGYDSSGPWLQPTTGFAYSSLLGFAELLGAGCNSRVTYAVSPDQVTWYWYNSGWVVSDGTTAQSSDANVLHARLADYAALLGPGTLYLRIFLNSNGNNRCELDSISVQGRL